MTKQEFKYYTNVFYDAFFRVADWKKEDPEDNGAVYSVQIHMPPESGTGIYRVRPVSDGNNRFWITSRNVDNSWYQLDDIHSNKVIRRVYTSTKGCIQSLLKSFLDVIEDELDWEDK